MKTMMILAAVCAAAMLTTTGCKCCGHCDKDSTKTAMSCDGSCCKDHDTCVKCCKDEAGCQKCCHKS
jgi:hypothetical protein